MKAARTAAVFSRCGPGKRACFAPRHRGWQAACSRWLAGCVSRRPSRRPPGRGSAAGGQPHSCACTGPQKCVLEKKRVDQGCAGSGARVGFLAAPVQGLARGARKVTRKGMCKVTGGGRLRTGPTGRALACWQMAISAFWPKAPRQHRGALPVAPGRAALTHQPWRKTAAADQRPDGCGQRRRGPSRAACPGPMPQKHKGRWRPCQRPFLRGV